MAVDWPQVYRRTDWPERPALMPKVERYAYFIQTGTAQCCCCLAVLDQIAERNTQQMVMYIVVSRCRECDFIDGECRQHYDPKSHG